MQLIKDFNHSYWEIKHYFKKYDLIVVGSGIVGLSTAISFKQKNKRATVLILEKGILPDGASSKNAGFACFGSAGEILSDLQNMQEQAVWETVQMRWKGLKLLRKRLSDKQLDYREFGGYELFRDEKTYAPVADQLQNLNRQMKKHLGIAGCYRISKPAKWDFGGIHSLISNRFEGQLDTASMMGNLLQLARGMEIDILNNIHVQSFAEKTEGLEFHTQTGIFTASQAVIATNGFASQLLNLKEVIPARAQVLITKPIKNLKLKGTFHFDEGYYYFRNIDGRILFGGGRNLDFEKERTSDQGLNSHIQENLDKYLKNLILPGRDVEVDHRWSGIMGVGTEKKPIIRPVGKKIIAAVRMGGMGIAIGSFVGYEAVRKLS